MLTQMMINLAKPMNLNKLYQTELQNKGLKGDRNLSHKDFSFAVEHNNGKPIYQLNHKLSNKSYHLTKSCSHKFDYSKSLMTNLTEDVYNKSFISSFIHILYNGENIMYKTIYGVCNLVNIVNEAFRTTVFWIDICPY